MHRLENPPTASLQSLPAAPKGNKSAAAPSSFSMFSSSIMAPGAASTPSLYNDPVYSEDSALLSSLPRPPYATYTKPFKKNNNKNRRIQPPRTASERPNYSQRFPAVTGRRRIQRVSYTPGNHLQVLFQMYGSALPQVLPYCLVSVAWTMVVHALKTYNMVDITFISPTAHTFVSILISFLLIERSRVSYSRYMENRKHLADCYRACRELIQLGCSYTFTAQTSKAVQWRQTFAFRIVCLLRVTMDCLEWASTHRKHWEELCDEEIDNDTSNDANACTKKPRKMSHEYEMSEHGQALREFSHGDRTRIDEAFRAPLLYEYALRETIMQHPDFLGYKLHANEYRDLVLTVSEFNKAFHGFRVLCFTPYPFSLVQMTRLFLFFWVYSLPLVLVAQMDVLYHTMIMMFLITFGFIGTEYVSMTLDDPFGHGVNDVDQTGMSELVFEDIYLTLYKVDGLEAARQVKQRVMERYAMGRGLECYRDDFHSSEFWENDPHTPYGDSVSASPPQSTSNRRQDSSSTQIACANTNTKTATRASKTATDTNPSNLHGSGKTTQLRQGTGPNLV